MFELYSAVIRHAGKRSYEIHRKNLTAPEIIVLRAIHGDDAVIAVKDTGRRDDKWLKDQGIPKDQPDRMHEARALMTNSGELARLRLEYKDFMVDDDKPIVDALWPGFNPQLPVSFEGKALAAEMVA